MAFVPAIRIGVSGWRYAPWRGNFYPKGLSQNAELEYAARFSDPRDQRLVLFTAKSEQLAELVRLLPVHVRREGTALSHAHAASAEHLKALGQLLRLRHLQAA